MSLSMLMEKGGGGWGVCVGGDWGAWDIWTGWEFEVGSAQWLMCGVCRKSTLLLWWRYCSRSSRQICRLC